MIISLLHKSMLTILYYLDRFFAYSFIICIHLFRPMLGPMNMCPLVKSGIEELGCTQYALAQLQKPCVHHACMNIARRLAQCHPFTKYFT